MPWPFSSPAAAPTSFAGPGAVVPVLAAEIAAGAAVTLLGLHFTNIGSAERTVTVTNSAGDILWKEAIPAGSGSQPYSPTFEPSTGLKWSVDAGAIVIGHVWGY